MGMSSRATDLVQAHILLREDAQVQTKWREMEVEALLFSSLSAV